MKVNELSILVGGEAGAGITRAGYLIVKAAIRGGLNAFGTNDYQSMIRGGHNYYVAWISDDEVYSQTDYVDLLIALNAETVMLHKDELAPRGGIIYDPDDLPGASQQVGRKDVKFYPIPLKKIVTEDLKQDLISRNTVALGSAIKLVDYDFKVMEDVLRDTFSEKAAEASVKAAQRGYDYAKDNFEDDFEYRLKRIKAEGKYKIFPTGNEAIGTGAISAGCKLYVAYPMTPVTGLLTFMAEKERDYKMIVLHPEGEIAAVLMAAGASFAGVRAMTATSGGGFCLMTEGLGMTGMTETPIVIAMGTRSGPSTGLPTYTGQGDLRFVLHASQGEFPRVVIAPGDVEECYYETMRAFNWAEKYQIPAIILVDKYLVESQMSVDPFDQTRVEIERGDLIITDKYEGEEEYGRHKVTETGVSPRVIPGTMGAIVRTNSDEHDESGYTTERSDITVKMQEKRMRKLGYLAQELEDRNVETTRLYGPEEADATIISWGSTKGPIREAMKLLNKGNISVNYLQVVYMQPFPTGTVEETLNDANRTVIVEHNLTSQLSGVIRQYTLKDMDHKILKYDGRPWNPRSLADKVKEVL
nr:2-oxoacid:acceptor oxidoreductase subunit alpha [Candidatus Njordarchaeum guaymaensis]